MMDGACRFILHVIQNKKIVCIRMYVKNVYNVYEVILML